ncbi:MAG: DedA family protein [Bacteroidota bacterium]
MEDFVTSLLNLNPLWVYLAIIGIAYIENILPPFPSDVIVVAAGSLVGLGTIDFFLALVLATVGSTTGFLTMYKIGSWFGHRIVETGKIRFLPLEGIHRVEAWFRRYGYWVIVGNRFLAGTRAVVSFFAGMSDLNLWKTVLLSAVSALAWNGILLLAGSTVGRNWREIVEYLETYSRVMTVIVLAAIAVAILFFALKQKKS